MARIPFGPRPVRLKCPLCKAENVETNVRAQANVRTHIRALILLICCLCWVPYCIESCKNINHYCPICDAYLGTYSND